MTPKTPLPQSRSTRRYLVLAGLLSLMVLALALAGCGGAEPSGAPPPEEEEEEPAEEAEATAQAATEAPEEEPADATPTAPATDIAEAVDVAFEGETAVRDGQASASGVLAVEDLGVGTVDASAPSEMTVGDTGTVRVEIAPIYDPEEVEVETYVTVTAVEDPVEVLNFYDELRLYSIMSANISAPSFDVETATPTTQRLNADTPALWVWNIIPRAPGRRSVTVSITVPIVIDDVVQDISTSPLRTIEFGINVLAPATATPLPTPTPTPTPSLLTRSLDEMGPEIIAGLVLGVLGAIGTFVWSRIRDRTGTGKRRKQ